MMLHNNSIIWIAFNSLTIFSLSVNTMAAEVEVYDFVKNEMYLISEDKLGPEMIRVNLDGKIYWANANQLTQNTCSGNYC
jgi:hypothetical protein